MASDFLHLMLGSLEQVVALEENFPAGGFSRRRRNQPQYRKGRGAFAAPGLADDAEGFLLVDVESNVIYGGEGAALETELNGEVFDLE